MKVGNRLFEYAMKKKTTIILALLMLAISVVAELSGPFIAKQMIDKHIVGIDKPWYESGPNENAVSYDGALYTREDRLVDVNRGKEVRLLQVGAAYYFVDGSIAFDGNRQLVDGKVQITNGPQNATYEATKLTTMELFSFYEPEVSGIISLAMLYMGILLIGGIFAYGQTFYLQKSSNAIIKEMRQDVFGHIQKLPISYFDHLPAGKIVSRVTNDTEGIRELFVTVLSTVVSSLMNICGIFIALYILNPTLASYCLVLFPIMYVWVKGYRKYASKYNHIIRSRLSDINGMINESIGGMSIIQVFRQEKATREEFEAVNKDYYDHQTKLLSLNAATGHNIVHVLRNLAYVAVIWHFGGEQLSGSSFISIGVLYAFIDYLNRMFQPLQGLVNQLANLEQSLVSAERVFQLLDEKGTDVVQEKIPRFEGNVSFKDVSFSYNDKDVVLRNINVDVTHGETVALVGHTGSGKSSIMNVLFGFYPFQEGCIEIDGYDIKEMPKQMYRQHMGIVLQDPFLFTGTIASNISLDNPTISREQIEQVVKEIGLDTFIEKLPKGLEEPVIEKGSSLSTGERQLISFARALAFNPAILVLDEATSSIDTETESIIQEALEVLKKGRTTFIIAHRLSTIRNADQILVLHRGEIVEKGSHEELMSKQGKYYHMYQIQVSNTKVSV